MTKQIIIATTNSGKLAEYRYVLSREKYPWQFLFLDELDPKIPAPEETGKTYYENALIKAEYYFNHFKIPVISDDSGIEFDVLDGFPGVDTAPFFYANKERIFQVLETKVTERDPEQKNRRISFHCCALYKDHNNVFSYDANIFGSYIFPPRGNKSCSYGYDPIFLLKNGLTLAELDINQKLRLSPRCEVVDVLLNRLHNSER